jgi:putative spermidine/putrescine transport system ATP-binding protein
MLSLRGLCKSFGDVVAVDGVDLELARGEFVTFLGPSGSGKTTTLQMIAGLQRPSGGRILLEGAPLDPLPPHRRNIGMVFQHYALFPHMTIAGNIAFPLEMRRVPAEEIRRRVGEVLDLVGLPDLADRYPAQLSGGQQQRVALARALVFRPPLLLMDEPLGALDRKLREQMQIEITRIHRELDASIVYVTHDQEEALVMSDRIAVFRDGRIDQLGTARELYERPRTSFVAGFIGETNFFPGRVLWRDGTLCALDTPAGKVVGVPAGPLAEGEAAVLAVRPERIAFTDDADGLEARVGDVIYLGNQMKYVLTLPDGRELTATQQTGTAPGAERAPGGVVRLCWAPDNATVLPSGPGAAAPPPPAR